MDSDSRLDTRRYNFSSFQLAYFLDEDFGTQNETDLKEDVLEVASNLDRRIQYLIEDIALLHEHNLLNKDSIDPTQIERHDQLHTNPITNKGIRRDEWAYLEPALHIGHILYLLYTSTTDEYDPTLLATGLLGLQGGFLTNTWSGHSNVTTFLDKLSASDEYFEEFPMPDDDTLETLNDVMEEIENSIKIRPAIATESESLREQLQASPLMITEPLIKHTESHFERPGIPRIHSVVCSIATTLTNDSTLHTIEELADQVESDIQISLPSTISKGPAAHH